MSQKPFHLTIEMMIGSYTISQLIYVATKLKLPDLTWNAPQTLEELATATHTDAYALQRVVTSLLYLGAFQRTSKGAYQLAPGNEKLVSTHPHSIVPYILISGEVYYKAFSELLHSVKTGDTGCKAVFGKNFFDLLQTEKDMGEHFNASMSQDAGEALDAYDFTSYRNIVDVGSGKGEITALLLQHYPHICVTLFDLPSVISDAIASMEQQSLTERCLFQTGDFFTDPLPRNGDMYILSRIIHDWDDEQALQILANCRKAMAPTSKLLLIEFIINDPPSAREALEDLFMLVVTGGQERTLEQFRLLLQRAGLQISRILTTRNRRCIIEAVPVEIC